MNATMLAELKKKQSSESVDEPEPAPRLSSAAYAAAPGFTREEAEDISRPALGRQVSGAL